MLPKIEETAKLINDISNATKEQDVGISQINTAMSELDCVTQTNATASNELSSAAEELDAQANDMNNMMAYYTTTKGSSLTTAQEYQSTTNTNPKQVTNIEQTNVEHAELDLRSFERF